MERFSRADAPLLRGLEPKALSRGPFFRLEPRNRARKQNARGALLLLWAPPGLP